MRFWSVLVVALVMLVTGCSKEIAGVAQVDPRGPATELSKDGFGIVVGDPKARVEIEIYTEPQCDHCADLQKDFGDELSRYMNLGQLVVTYRPLTFLDDKPGGYSDRVSNAMFLAAGPKTSAKAFQAFVQDLWGHQEQRGSKGPTDTEIADMARESGVAPAAVDAMRAGKPALDLIEMADTNFEYLYEIDPISTGTPTVFDLTNNEKIDIYDNNWLSKLMST
ncbi:protein-disulfide isomerase [Mycolicibacterium sp. BK556]|uniref:DsbA family protein n=1 Tax=unclassified Mycolicibacterium TaxID=2636767 RepID=UPI0016134547|nr:MULTISPECIES: thioredoxin domain-containing protein [unclassified Mycolicibacterium]MBB3605280.1 protein-disulfide isomerase [Mycolicibacterium sp. BK556]MBB3635476.1 protein-disulfide isomerase [Mycolicibacterium sp. BK607]MBB3747730.1 protein-disulfide isomerase [Mycolicibacterium sp. BK634]